MPGPTLKRTKEMEDSTLNPRKKLPEQQQQLRGRFVPIATILRGPVPKPGEPVQEIAKLVRLVPETTEAPLDVRQPAFFLTPAKNESPVIAQQANRPSEVPPTATIARIGRTTTTAARIALTTARTAAKTAAGTQTPRSPATTTTPRTFATAGTRPPGPLGVVVRPLAVTRPPGQITLRIPRPPGSARWTPGATWTLGATWTPKPVSTTVRIWPPEPEPEPEPGNEVRVKKEWLEPNISNEKYEEMCEETRREAEKMCSKKPEQENQKKDAPKTRRVRKTSSGAPWLSFKRIEGIQVNFIDLLDERTRGRVRNRESVAERLLFQIQIDGRKNAFRDCMAAYNKDDPSVLIFDMLWNSSPCPARFQTDPRGINVRINMIPFTSPDDVANAILVHESANSPADGTNDDHNTICFTGTEVLRCYNMFFGCHVHWCKAKGCVAYKCCASHIDNGERCMENDSLAMEKYYGRLVAREFKEEF